MCIDKYFAGVGAQFRHPDSQVFLDETIAKNFLRNMNNGSGMKEQLQNWTESPETDPCRRNGVGITG